MNFKSKRYLTLLVLLNSLLLEARAGVKEVEIPGGWDLSATLALFRNQPLIDDSSFSATQGDVFYMKQVEESSSGESIIFRNSYSFYRKSGDRHFLEVKVTEEHRITTAADGNDPNSNLASHRVADLT